MRPSRLAYVLVLAVTTGALDSACSSGDDVASRWPEADAMMREAAPIDASSGEIRLGARRAAGTWRPTGLATARIVDARTITVNDVRIEREGQELEIRGDVVRVHGAIERRVFARGAEIEELAVSPKAPSIDYRFVVPPGHRLRSIAPSVVELDAADGTPVLRMRADKAWDSSGKVLDVRLAIAGDVVSASVPRDAALPVLIDPTWMAVSSPVRTHGGHSATLLGDGRVLFAGGGSTGADGAELYDPRTGLFMAVAAKMTAPRVAHVSATLADGRVLLAGGAAVAVGVATILASAEIFDPASSTFTATGSMTAKRTYHAATRLDSGRVLVAGCEAPLNAPGVPDTDHCAVSVDVYDPATGVFSAAPSPGVQSALWGNVAVEAVPGGAVVIGRDVATVFDEATTSWTPLAGVTSSPRFRVAKKLRDGRVFVTATQNCVNGEVDCTTTAQLLDPTTGAFSAASPAIPPNGGETSVVELPSGKVLLVGGFVPSQVTRIFDPATGTTVVDDDATFAHNTASTTSLPGGDVLVMGLAAGAELRIWTGHVEPTAGAMVDAREHANAQRLRDGRVLILGGWRQVAPDFINFEHLTTAELFDPSTRTFAPTGSPMQARAFGVTALLPSGEVLLAGGLSPSRTALATAERYDPSTGQFAAAGGITTARYNAAAVRLASGKILIAGGCSSPNVNCSAEPQAKTAELFDPATGTSQPTGAMLSAHERFALIPLPNGSVLVQDGGQNELYDPETGAFTATTSVTYPGDHGAGILLPSGKVFVSGNGANGSRLFDATTQTWTPFSGPSYDLGYAKWAPMPDGIHVLLTGAMRENPIGQSESRITVVDTLAPANNTTIARDDGVGSGRVEHAAAMIAGGVLAFGGGTLQGNRGDPTLDTAWVYTDGAQASARPVLSTAPATIAGGARAVITGQRFSPTGATPLAYWVPDATETVVPGRILDFTATSATFEAPATALNGHGWLHVVTDGLTSNEVPVEVTPAIQGAVCRFDAECASGLCTEGFCCDTRCGDKCQACSARRKGSGEDGTCGAVAPGKDPDGKCVLEQGVECTSHDQCATGQCAQGVCCASACAETCFSCALAASRGTCSVDDTCGCDGDHTLKKGGQADVDCSPFRCAGPSCRSECASVNDCAAGFVCDTAGRCVPLPNVEPGSESLFGCAATSRPAGSSVVVIGFLALLLARRRRR